MGRLLDVSWKTVERMEEHRRLPSSSTAILRLDQIRQIADLGRLVYTPEGFVRFLATPLPTFAGCTALQMIERGASDQVIGALASDYEGAPT